MNSPPSSEIDRIETDYSLDALCARILAKHRAQIRTRKPHLAIANLALIVDATIKLSNRQGFHATSLRDLAKATGISMGGLYSYFDTKDTLLMMILGEVASAASDVLGGASAETVADPREHLRWLIRAHIRLTERMLPWFVFAFMEAKAFPAAGKAAAVESELAVEKIFADVVARGVAQGVFRACDPLMSAALIKPLLQEWYVKRAKYRRRGVDWQRYAESVTNFVEGTLSRRSGDQDRE